MRTPIGDQPPLGCVALEKPIVLSTSTSIHPFDPFSPLHACAPDQREQVAQDHGTTVFPTKTAAKSGRSVKIW
jgi:hypothetical protein